MHTDSSVSSDTIKEELRWLHAETFDMDVFLASRKHQKLSKTAAAIYIITQEDIRRSSATCVPEVLRMVPGLQVARIDANKWAVASRGFNSRFADMLLVLIDGRTVYTPLLSGVFWDVQNLMLEDVDHIEVVRGPGSTLWGSNAVNGIINIVTKKTKDTKGGLVTGMGGD
ncbi:MAG: TonB-dependent receptor plug domain-containing protein [Candidatus Scalindua sp.]|nr:TonB-dependent receptor plug domain-containing protein [Candidatus Scalindua sp.]